MSFKILDKMNEKWIKELISREKRDQEFILNDINRLYKDLVCSEEYLEKLKSRLRKVLHENN